MKRRLDDWNEMNFFFFRSMFITKSSIRLIMLMKWWVLKSLFLKTIMFSIREILFNLMKILSNRSSRTDDVIIVNFLREIMMFKKLLEMNVFFCLTAYFLKDSMYYLWYRQSSYQYESDEHILHKLDAFIAFQQSLHHDNSSELSLSHVKT